jgi:hypothetical protein
MGEFVYRVRQADVTDYEPTPGWYVASGEGGPVGPFGSHLEAHDAMTGGEAAETTDPYKRDQRRNIERAVAAERAAIVRAIKAEAEDYRAKARDIWLSDARPSLADMRRSEELRAACAALRRAAVVISQRETEDRP